MKKSATIFTLAVAALLASCSSDSIDPNPNFPADGVIRVSTGVGDPTSRAGQDNTNLTSFNISINSGDPQFSYYACMKKNGTNWDSYSAENGGATPLVMKWKDNKTPIQVTALCVNNKNRNSEAFISESIDCVELDQSTPELVKASDILYMPKKTINPGDKTYFNSAGALKLELPHFLSKLNIELTLGSGFFTGDIKVTSASDIKNLQVHGTKTKFKWNPSASGSLTLVDESVYGIETCYIDETFKPENGDKTATYECIVVPQPITKEAFSVQIKILGVPYVFTLSKDLLLASDNVYTIPIIVDRATPPQIGKISVSKWASGPDKLL